MKVRNHVHVTYKDHLLQEQFMAVYKRKQLLMKKKKKKANLQCVLCTTSRMHSLVGLYLSERSSLCYTSMFSVGKKEEH